MTLTSMQKTQVVPTHLCTPETVLTFGGLSLSARQFLLLLVGSALSYDVWKHLGFLIALPGGGVLAATVALFPALVACALAFGRAAGRDLIPWALVLLRYAIRPKRLIWHSVRFQEPGTGNARESDVSEESEDVHA